MKFIRRFWRAAPLSFLLLQAPSLTWACSVCFGQDPASGEAQGFFWGVLLLLLLPWTLFAVLGFMLYYNMRKIRRQAED